MLSTANQTINSGFFSTKEEQYMHDKLLEIQQQRRNGKNMSKLESFGLQQRMNNLDIPKGEYYQKNYRQIDSLDKRIYD